jgi:hypothetical protein
MSSLVSANKAEHSLRVLENRVLREVFGCQGKEVPGDSKALRIEELLLCVNRDLIMQNGMGGLCST